MESTAPVPTSRVLWADFQKQKIVHSKGRHGTLCQPARDARGRRASRLKVHTSHLTDLHDLRTSQRGCPLERVITPPMIVPPSTSKSRSAGLLHTHKRRNPAARVHMKRKRRARYHVCTRPCPLLCSVRRARDSATGPIQEKEANSFRFLGRHTGPQQ